ncbi:CDK-activating kinase assembly factor [Clathrospora elynae]|uniref:RNA polymerase II transcription factor B subunit 3 n=1 Tax=Clathrospora elynae TaxID=706981 RepID=A0A6A5SD43_9PLEO|nr:CDK-activating kinase assembly factor [Clathrospora elynae]
MSKQPARAAAASKRLAEDGDICPVCKSSRYLNSTMQFKINPACYHRMCDTCVERIFKRGNSTCPIAGCAKTLSWAKFRRATFEDLKIEREVDIRKTVMDVMNKKEEDFETLRDYNDYLEQVEEIAWNLILNIDVEATTGKLERWKQHQKAELDAGPPLASGKGATQRKASQSSKKKDEAETGFTFHGLKKRVAPVKEAPYDPWGGWSIAPQYYVLQDNYDVDWYKRIKTDVHHVAGGHSLQDYCSQALRDAFGGLGVFIEDEILARDTPSMDADVGTEHAVAAAMSGKDANMNVNMDDVF